MKSYTEVPCDTCHKPVQIESRYVKYHKKFDDSHQYFCDEVCRLASQKTGQNLKCETCGTDIYVTAAEIRDYEHHFCSHACSATFSNKNRKIETGKTKEFDCIECGEKTTTSIRCDAKKVRCETCKEKRKLELKELRSPSQVSTKSQNFPLVEKNYKNNKIIKPSKFEKQCLTCPNVFIGTEKRKYCDDCNQVARKNAMAKARSERDFVKEGDHSKDAYTRIYFKNCMICTKLFAAKKSNIKCCSEKCKHEANVLAGKRSAQTQFTRKRSRNEIMFAELCKTKFNVLENISMFNGWDADVILPDLKIAILWNGNWHHKKITEKHSVKQVQNRDKIKQKEIINAGYTPYVIDDFGKENLKFVEEQFVLFIDWLQLRV